MFQIEKLNETSFYIKAIGTFPPTVAQNFVKEFEDLTREIKSNLRVIVDITDAIFLKFDSIEIILDLLKRDNEKLYKSAFVISKNPPLDEEFTYILKKAQSPKRKIVSNLDEAKKWIEIEDIIFRK